MNSHCAKQILEAISRVRTGRQLGPELIRDVVSGFLSDDIPDYQMAALLMAIACCDLSFEDTVALTQAYVDSGERMDLSEVEGHVVDKHSTGGVGDKTSLFCLPIVAACGVPVVKLSGRGLGFAGGTLDKMSAIPGLRTSLSPAEAVAVVRSCGMAILSQTADLVPADGATYALRDVTGSVISAPLIAASIMSKKIAGGADGVVLDVKYGVGSLVGTLDAARQLARLMVKMGGEMGLPTRALLTSMEQPLGHAVGNTLEILEVWDALSGVVEVQDLTELGLTLASQMLLMARPQLGLEDARTLTTNALATGAAKDVFISWIDQQGGDVAAMESRRGMQLASSITEVRAPHDGWISRINAKAVGELLLDLGGGRRSKNDSIDLGVGVCVAKKVGDIVAAGDVVLKVMSRSELDIDADKFFNFSHEFVPSPSLVEELVI